MAKVTVKDEQSPVVRLKDAQVGTLIGLNHGGVDHVCYVTYTAAVSLTNPWITFGVNQSGEMEVKILPVGFSVTLVQDRKPVENPYAQD